MSMFSQNDVANFIYVRDILSAAVYALGGLAFIFCFCSPKNIPGIWHARLLSAILYHTQFRKSDVVSAERDGGQAIFLPVATSSRSPLAECDVNGHKSNSTYFSDLDVNRIHLITRLFKAATNEHGARIKTPRFLLGGASCSWRREIKPYAPYEIHSRILTWDEKWVYIVSHFVEVDSRAKATEQNGVWPREKVRDLVFASAISKYVFKDGRKTVAPAQAFKTLQLLPKAREFGQTKPDMWDDLRVEEERQKGMETALHFAALDKLHTQFADTISLRSHGVFGFYGRNSDLERYPIAE